MIHVTTWLWGQDKYGIEDVSRLRDAVGRHLSRPHRFLCVRTDDSLTKVKGCLARLRMFSPAWQAAHGIKEGDRIVLMDLDTIVTGGLDPTFDRLEPFVIMKGANAANPCPFNGALQLLTAGYRPDVWQDFSLEAAAEIPFHSFPDDQGWLWHKIPDAAGWTVGLEHGIYVYNKPGWPGGDDLPQGARLVTFINKHPSQFTHLPWVREHWLDQPRSGLFVSSERPNEIQA